MNKLIAATGLSGMAGSKIAQVLKNKYQFLNLSLENGINILDKNTLNNYLRKQKIDFLLHLAAKTDVDACEKEKELGEKSQTWITNVKGTQNVAEICRDLKIKMIYISTDFVFDGRKNRAYTEEDTPNPINFYGQTKLTGEKVVQKYLDNFLICRLAFIYGGNHEIRKDFVDRIKTKLKNKEKIRSVTDEVFTPTLISDIAIALDNLLEKKCSGIYHVVGGSSLSPYEASLEIAKQFGYDINLISKTSWEEFYKNKAKRPQFLEISNKKLETATGYKMHSFEEGLKLL